jgi:hypothetical protein
VDWPELAELVVDRARKLVEGDDPRGLAILQKAVRSFDPPETDRQAVRWDGDNWAGKTHWVKDTRARIDRLRCELELNRDGDYLLIRREDVFDRAGDTVNLFLAAMAWGFGTTGYGWWRTAEIVNPGIRNGERRVAAAVDSYCDAYTREGVEGVARAWAQGDGKVPGLGPAFASKLAYFACYDRAAGAGPPSSTATLRGHFGRSMGPGTAVAIPRSTHSTSNGLSAWRKNCGADQTTSSEPFSNSALMSVASGSVSSSCEAGHFMQAPITQRPVSAALRDFFGTPDCCGADVEPCRLSAGGNSTSGRVAAGVTRSTVPRPPRRHRAASETNCRAALVGKARSNRAGSAIGQPGWTSTPSSRPSASTASTTPWTETPSAAPTSSSSPRTLPGAQPPR